MRECCRFRERISNYAFGIIGPEAVWLWHHLGALIDEIQPRVPKYVRVAIFGASKAHEKSMRSKTLVFTMENDLFIFQMLDQLCFSPHHLLLDQFCLWQGDRDLDLKAHILIS